jgi:hypothetical protein
MSYEREMQSLILRVETETDDDNRQQAFLDLLHRLGCQTKWSVHNYQVPQPEADHELFVRGALVQLLQQHVNRQSNSVEGWSLVDGLSKHKRWVEAHKSIEGSYALAYLTLTVSQYILDVENRPNGGAYFWHDRHVLQLRMPLCALFNEWLTPDAPYTNVPTIDVLLRAIFGDVWFELTLANSPEMETLWPSAVRTLRPAFRDGLVPSQIVDIVTTIPLPLLMEAP